MPADKRVEIALVPMPVNPNWMHVYYDGQDTDHAIEIRDLGDLKAIIDKYRLRAKMRNEWDRGSAT